MRQEIKESIDFYVEDSEKAKNLLDEIMKTIRDSRFKRKRIIPVGKFGGKRLMGS